MEIIAHRGASRDAPENTLAAVNLAWAQGADAVEVDVQFSKDGHVVVIHDGDTRKTAGVAKKVGNQTLAELRRLDVGRWKDPKWTGERIPTLAEVLATIPPGKRLFVEIKCGPECIPALADDFRSSGRKPAQVVLIGFDLETMKRAKQALPQLEVCWVAEFKRNWRGGWSPSMDKLIADAKSAGLDGLDLSARGPWSPRLGSKVHGAGLTLYVWTVDSLVKARQLIAAGADGITTNKPGWMRERFRMNQRIPDLLACPCCGSNGFTALGRYEICATCSWEDDPIQLADPGYAGGANEISLNQARMMWQDKHRRN